MKKIHKHTLLLDVPNIVSINKYGVIDIKPGTVQAYRLACQSFLKFLERDNIKFGKLSKKKIFKWSDRWLGEQSISVHTANSYRRSLKAMLRKCGREDLAEPIHQAKPPARESKAMSDENLAKALMYASVRDAAIIMFIRDSGARRGAVCSLRYENFRIWCGDSGDLRMAAKVWTKGDKYDLVLAGHQCATAVNLWLSIRPVQSAEYLFTTSDGRPLHPQTLNSVFKRLRVQAKIPADENFFPHSLRHRFAQKMLDELDAKVVSQLMGHSKVSTTLDIYGHRDEESLINSYFSRNDKKV